MKVARQGTVTKCNSSGTIKQIHNILYVPGVRSNLFSVGRLTDIGYRVLFESKHCLVYDKNHPTQLFLRGIRESRNNLYKVTNFFRPPDLITQVSTISSHPQHRDVKFDETNFDLTLPEFTKPLQDLTFLEDTLKPDSPIPPMSSPVPNPPSILVSSPCHVSSLVSPPLPCSPVTTTPTHLPPTQSHLPPP